MWSDFSRENDISEGLTYKLIYYRGSEFGIESKTGRPCHRTRRSNNRPIITIRDTLAQHEGSSFHAHWKEVFARSGLRSGLSDKSSALFLLFLLEKYREFGRHIQIRGGSWHCHKRAVSSNSPPPRHLQVLVKSRFSFVSSVRCRRTNSWRCTRPSAPRPTDLA